MKKTMFFVMALMVATAQAAVVDYSTTVNYQGATIPASLELDQVTSDTEVYLYDGYKGVEYYGWIWNSYLVHFDPLNSSPQKVVSGYIEFDRPIATIIGSEADLDYYESLLGPSTVYEETRELEDSGGNVDDVSITDYTVVDFTLRATDDIDEFIIVEAEPVVVFTDILDGPEYPEVGEEECWTIEICVEAIIDGVTNVIVQGGIGADLNVTMVNGVPVTYPMAAKTSQTIGDVTLSKKGGKMGATIVTWIVGDLDEFEGDCIELVVCTGLNPKDKQEYTSEGLHDLDGGFSAVYMWDGNELESPETVPLTVEAVLP